MQIKIKKALLEGYQLEEIIENVNNFLANNNTSQDRIGGIIGGIGTAGLAGGGLATYGNLSNNNRQYQTVNHSLVSNDGSIGPWDKSMIARGQFFNNLDNRASNLYDTNKVQYFLNPFAAGPISHTFIKGSRDINNALYKVLKNQNSPELQNKVTVVANPTNGPVNAGLDTIRNSSNNYADDIATIRRNNPGHYYLNPFVAGPVNEFVGGHLGGAIAQGIRVASSPTTKSDDTLVYNTGRR